ncbi:23S rRNA pseudouridine(955/2504/2580) synthase RluC [Thalassotalea sp. Y01]|uniref:23S rRNA pseudouridine(955/2504/2580) synthase RluC n=1 Tax=Thalassotalea sp. Y01 TaxID=2729613 RepID=UPI00145EDBD0|nr:23S rRNA pseudouridine(955/2504/2580) synthase RluC [Thalassotalea sp. Y01]NMP15571.1 23S rRNA pseudouridine(955/2504/2580) synthase RluC [Thalassotalea sp. Y01]
MKDNKPKNPLHDKRKAATNPSENVAEPNADRPKVRFITVDEDSAGQRIDNFLLRTLKGVPKSMIYRLLRKGEVRVNKKRTKPEYKLQTDDLIRVAPIRVSEKTDIVSTKLDKVSRLEQSILFEDDCLIVINKPSGMAVHGGSGLSFGLIEALRALRPQAKMLELVHRLDRDTSGCLVVAKKRSALRHLHEQLRSKKVQKFYHALVKGHWPTKLTKVTEGLRKNELKSGERVVIVDNVQGKESETRYRVIKHFEGASLVRAFPVTGRTHQIRVHCQCSGFPIACDAKYGAEDFTATMNKQGLKRLFLHAHSIEFEHPRSAERVRFEAPYDAQLTAILKKQTIKTY